MVKTKGMEDKENECDEMDGIDSDMRTQQRWIAGKVM